MKREIEDALRSLETFLPKETVEGIRKTLGTDLAKGEYELHKAITLLFHDAVVDNNRTVH